MASSRQSFACPSKQFACHGHSRGRVLSRPVKFATGALAARCTLRFCNGRGRLCRQALRELDGDDVDAIVQVGTNLSMVQLAVAAEFFLGKPVIAINTATWWHALRAAGIDDRIEGFGQLLSEF